MEIVDKQIPTLNTYSRSSIFVHQQTENIPATMNESQSTLFETDVIRLEEEHAMSIIVPDQDISVLDEQFEVIQTKTSQILNSEDQIGPIQSKVSHNVIPKEASNLNYDSNDTSQKSPSMTTSHENNFDQEKQSISSIANDQSQSMITPSSSHSNVDLSEQLVTDNASTSEDNFESPQKQLNSENDEKTSSGSTPEHITVNLISTVFLLL
jgi:hypothetical protein